MTTPAISVIVPVFNSAKYLRECLDSIYSQSLSNIEVILINDGSTDDSPVICKEYEMKDNRFKLYSISNSGAAVARNLGLQVAKGKYIGFVDSDDFIDHLMFERLYETALKFNADIVGCNFIECFKDKEFKNKNTFQEGFYSKQDIVDLIFPNIICSKNLTTGFPRTMVTKIFSHELIKKHSISFVPGLKASQDVVFTTNCMVYSDGFYHLGNEYLYYYRQINQSRTNRYLANSWNIFKLNLHAYRKISNEINYYDFKNQIYLATIRSAMTSINYEGKKESGVSHKIRIHNIREILHDEELIKALSEKQSLNVNLTKRILITFMKYKLAFLCYAVTLIHNKINERSKFI